MKREKGSTFIEVLVAVALLGIIAVLFLGGVANSSSMRVTADERASAKILAQGLMDDIKKEPYQPSYNLVVPGEFGGYSANLTVTGMANGHIQKLTIVIKRTDRDLLTLEGYKVER
jgi:prepilin-type N-terminal cleavage/methylation domain-containing protein